jgi:hypothetical protein
MRKNLINDPFRNPFHNRFHVPVHSRLDEMQTNMHLVWPNSATTLGHETERDQHLRGWGRAVAGAFALVLVVVISAVLLSN